MDGDDIDEYNHESEEEQLQASEIARSVPSSLGALEKTINDLQQDQVLMLESVAKFGNRTERR
ncbi:hypothetical protein P3T76_008352 [Phytophthora citrophthora]|uniref:Uncharacterized protein n=1 Tax=Phytophthora citrophthora TaxID=4793 RepID=A0AAD9LM12_9STRA|nr:hypothetical protein P3T76_008352 [Phytophthora citrophthora]